jgi:hypothetical protein
MKLISKLALGQIIQIANKTECELRDLGVKTLNGPSNEGKSIEISDLYQSQSNLREIVQWVSLILESEDKLR